MKKLMAGLLCLCLCLGLGGAAAASGEPDGGALTLLNGRENKSEVYGTDTWYAESLSAAALETIANPCTVVYTRDEAGVTAALTADVHGEYTTTVNGAAVLLVPMDEVIVLGPGTYEADYDAGGKNVLLVLEDGAALTGALTDVSLSMQAGARWTLTADSTLRGLDACRATVREGVYGNGCIGWYDSEVALSADMREWTEQLADTRGAWTCFSEPEGMDFDAYRNAVLAGDKADVIFHDNVLLPLFPANMAALITASVYDGEADPADVAETAGVYKWTDEYAELREGCGYAGGDIAYDTAIATDPKADGEFNRSSLYATDGVMAYRGLRIDELSYATSIIYADGTNRAQDAMMKYGVNSAVWAQGADAVIDLDGFYCLGANDGLYATYGGTVIAQNGVLDVTANHGLQICYDGTILARNLDIVTTGMMGSAISSDHGGGFLFCDNVFALAAYGSTGGSGIYCDGYCDFWIQNSAVGSLNDHAAVMCGGGTLNLVATTLFSRYDSSALPQSASGEASGASGEASGEASAEKPVTYGAGVYIHPMGNNPSRVTTLNLQDVTMKVPGYGLWTFGKSTDVTVRGTLDVSEVGSGILLYARQMDGGSDFVGGLTLDRAYPIPENVTTVTFDGGTLVGAGDIVYAAEDAESGNCAEIHLVLKNASDYSGAVQADSVTIDETSVWHVTGESRVTTFECSGALDGLATLQADGSWLIVPA